MAEHLGGLYNGLTCEKIFKTGKLVAIRFENTNYGMIMNAYGKDLARIKKHPYSKFWSSDSHSNNVEPKDMDIILSVLEKEFNRKKRYKTVTDVIKSRSKLKEKYLHQFDIQELVEYLNGKEKANGKT